MAKFLNLDQSPLLGSDYLEAINFAFDAHYRQVRKGQIECPYITHLLAVSGLVLEAGGNEDEAIAALLHDCVEDTDATLQDIKNEFGEAIASIVSEVSEDKGVRESERKMSYVRSVENMSWSALRVSIADKLHNIRCYSVNRELFQEKQKFFYHQLLLAYEARFLDDPLRMQVSEIASCLASFC
jgi:(p)ppGpp synthase/HD superfamily hydrolase